MKAEVQTHKSRGQALPRQQSGAVLIVSLVMLLLLTIIGMSAVDMTTLDTRISANTKDKVLAFDAAEAALNTAGNSLMPGQPLPDTSTPGFLTSVQADNWWQSTDDTWWTTNGEMITNYPGRTNASAGIGYVIEQPVLDSKGVMLGQGQGNMEFFCLYRVTARGEGPGGTEVHVQSVYKRKVYKPNCS